MKKLPKEEITLDTNQHAPWLEQAIFDYADLAWAARYKDVQLVFSPLLLMERTSGYMNLEQMKTKPHLSSHVTPLLKYRHRIDIKPFNEPEYDFLNNISEVFKKYITDEIKHEIPPQAIKRIQEGAFALQKTGVFEDIPVAASAADIDPFDFSNPCVTAALYSVSAARKYIPPEIMHEIRFNAADFSQLMSFEEHLSPILTPDHKRSAKTIFITNDHMLQDELIKAAQNSGNIKKATLYSRTDMMDYMQEQLQNIKKNIALKPSMLDEIDRETLARFDATMTQWQLHRKDNPSHESAPRSR